MEKEGSSRIKVKIDDIGRRHQGVIRRVAPASLYAAVPFRILLKCSRGEYCTAAWLPIVLIGSSHAAMPPPAVAVYVAAAVVGAATVYVFHRVRA